MKLIGDDSPFELLARAGYAARGMVYVLVGIICLMSGAGVGSGQKSASGALTFLRELPFGQILLAIIALGLFGYALWRLAQSLLNADGRDGSAKDWAVRAGQFVSAITHAGLGIYAAGLAINMASSSSSGGNSSQGAVAKLMQQPFGPWLVGLVGAIVIGVGVAQIYRGVAMKYLKWMDLPDEHENLLRGICTWGLAVRGLLFLIAGGFIVYAAITFDPGKAGSMSDALDWLRRLPFGAALYLGAALGLIAFGLYSIIEGVYRQIDGVQKKDLRSSLPSFG